VLSGCQWWEDEESSAPPVNPLEEPHRLRILDKRVEEDANFPAEFNCEFIDTLIEAGDPAELAVSVRNPTSDSLTIHGGAGLPFGVPFLLRTDSEDAPRVTAWNEDFKNDPHLSTDKRAVLSSEVVNLEETVHAGETIRKTYKIFHDSPGIAPGTYKTWRTLRLSDSQSSTKFMSTTRWDIRIEPASDSKSDTPAASRTTSESVSGSA